MDSYLAPKAQQRFELEIKRSRFISSFSFVENTAAAKDFIQVIRTEFPDASHNCWGFIAGAPNDVHQVDQSDDGEPKGTAGKPILNVLQHSGLGNIACVVTRYFGGIKLGAGGLVRAYSQSVSHHIDQLETVAQYRYANLEFELPYSLLGTVEYWLNQKEIKIESKNFGNAVDISISVPERNLPHVKQQLIQLSSDQICFFD